MSTLLIVPRGSRELPTNESSDVVVLALHRYQMARNATSDSQRRLDRTTDCVVGKKKGGWYFTTAYERPWVSASTDLRDEYLIVRLRFLFVLLCFLPTCGGIRPRFFFFAGVAV